MTSPFAASEFVAQPNRDAFATQRGYLYQAILSVKAWVELTQSELLALESGEDIDWVHLADSSSRREVDRTLGQVKFRKKRLSLRSPEALEGIVNYWLHIRRNPSLRLHFRFISNAVTTSERGKRYRLPIPGIDLWTSLPTVLQADELDARLVHIRALLLSATKPATTQILSWDSFRQFIETSGNEALLSFLNGFKWMLRSTDVDEALESVRVVLRTRPELKEHQSAVSYCLRSLLIEVLRTLSEPSGKILSSLDCSLALKRSVEESLSAAHADLSSIFAKISKSADSFELTIRGLKRITDDALTTVEDAGELLALRRGLAYGVRRPLLNPPVPTEQVAERRYLAVRALEHLLSGRCLYVVGDVGIGKTILSQLVASEFERVYWARLRVNSGIDPTLILDSVLQSWQANLAQIQPSEYSQIFASIDRRTLLIVDDFDVAASQERFLERLILTARATSGSCVSLLVTSNIEPPGRLAFLFELLYMEGFRDEDIDQLLKVHDCPGQLNNTGFRALILSTTGKHPLLTAALLRFLEERNWQVTSETVSDLMSQSFARDVRKEMQNRLVANEDVQTREFLYRLSLIDFAFNESQAIELASISPELPRAAERLTSLAGIWLQRVSRELFAVSPLFSRQGGSNLTADVRKRVHGRVARWILRKRELDQFQTISAIAHLTASGQYNLAGVVLLQALQAALSLESIDIDRLGLSLWSDFALPAEMNRGVRMMVRGLQVALFARSHRSFEFPLADLRALISEASEPVDRFAVVAACGQVATYLISEQPLVALELCTIMLTNETLIDDEMQAQLAMEHEISELLWLIGAQLKTIGEMSEWFSAVARLNMQQRRAFANSEFAADAGWGMFQRLWVEEQKKSENERQWGQLLAALEQWEAMARSAQLDLVAACVCRAQEAIRIVHLHQVEEGITRARLILASLPPDSVASFLICSGTGLWLTDTDSPSETAIEWMELASAYRGSAVPYLQMANQLRLAEALSGLGRNPRVAFDRALLIASDADTLSDVDRAVVQAERAIWLWMGGQLLESFSASEEAVAILLAQGTHGQRWRHTFVLLGNNLSYHRANACGESTGRNLTVPFLGMFTKDINDLSGMYSDGTQWIVPATLSWLAQALAQFDKAGEWALRAVEIADEVSADPKGGFLLIEAVPNCLKARDFDTAIDYARRSALVSTEHHPFKMSDEMRAIKPDLFKESTPVQLPPVSAAEKWAVVTGVFPAFLDVVSLSVLDETQAYTAAVSLGDKCRSVAAESRHSELWQAASTAITRSLVGEVDWGKELVVDPSDFGDDEHVSLLLISFGSGFGNRRAPKDVFLAQIRWARWLGAYFGRRRTGISAFIDNMLGQFWLHTLAKRRFYFRTPSEIERRLEKAIEQGSGRAVFLAAADGLGVILPNDLRSYLATAE